MKFTYHFYVIGGIKDYVNSVQKMHFKWGTLYVAMSHVQLHQRYVPSLFWKATLGSLKSLFQLDHLVDINIYFIKAIAFFIMEH